jgi:hypothetical protein
MAQIGKTLLSGWLKPELAAKFGSLAKASRHAGVGYERLRKQLERDTYNKEDLMRLLPNMSIEDLTERFEFTYRSNPRHEPSEIDLAVRTGPAFQALTKNGSNEEKTFRSIIDEYFLGMKYINPTMSLEELMLGVYSSLKSGDVQVLFYDPSTYEPVEWKLRDGRILNATRRLIKKGASLCYVAPYTYNEKILKQFEERYPGGNPPETPKLNFLRFANDVFRGMKSDCPKGDSSEWGQLAHIRVTHSPFACPFQKWSVFSIHDQNWVSDKIVPLDNKLSLLTTTINRPRRDGKVDVVEIALTQSQEILVSQLKFASNILFNFAEGKHSLDTTQEEIEEIEIIGDSDRPSSDEEQKRVARKLLEALDYGV